MRRKTTLTLALMFVTSFALTPRALARMAQPFEGTKWKVTVTPEDGSAGAKEFQTILEFKGGKFTSSECAKMGFKPVEYDEEMAPGGLAASFTAEPVSEKHGKAKWHGNVTAGEMRGEMTLTKPDGTVVDYTIKGERMAK
jgi:hypothetical protein